MSIDLSLLTPEIVQQIDADTIHSELIADYSQRMADEGQPVNLKVGDPVYNEMLTYAHRETNLRQEFQDISKQNMVAFATGNNLQQLAGLRPVEKQEGETDERFRKRVQLAPEGFSVAGPRGAYIKHGLDADVGVKDIYPDGTDVNGSLNLYVLSTETNGTASAELLPIVSQYLNAEKIRPLNDPVNVFSASIIEYAVVSVLYLDGSLGEAVVLDNARASVAAYVEKQHRLGVEVPRSALIAALHVEGVRKVVLTSPSSSLAPEFNQAAYCTNITVVKGE